MPLIEVKPLPEKLSLRRRMLAKLPGFCKFCGARYIEITGDPADFNPFAPGGKTGRGCPNGHEGHLKEYNSGGYIDEWKFDNMKPSTTQSTRGI